MAKVRYVEWSGLLNIGVSDFMKQPNELEAAKNCFEYEIGKLQKVPGYDLASNSQVFNGKSVNFLHYSKISTGDNYLIAGSDSGANYKFRYIAPDIGSPVTTWTDISSGIIMNRAGSEISMVNYLDKAFGVGYDGATYLNPFTIKLTTYAEVLGDVDLTGMPKGKYITKYRGLLYVLNAYEGATLYPTRAYFSNDPVGGVISWDILLNSLNFGDDDGDEIMGGCEALDRLLVFKRFSLWKYDESSVKQVASIGCDSNKSIVKIDGIPYWFNRSGVYRWGGSQPQLISSKVQEYIDAIYQPDLHKVKAVQYDFEYRLYIGDVTVKGILYTNCSLCFDTRREKWYVRCTYNKIESACEFVQASKKRAYFGDDNGYVYKFATKIDNIYSDNGVEIDSFFITGNLDFGAAEIIKNVSKLTVFSKNPQGMALSIDGDSRGQFDIGRGIILNRNVELVDLNSAAFRYKFRFSENSKNQSWQFEGFIVETEIKEEP